MTSGDTAAAEPADPILPGAVQQSQRGRKKVASSRGRSKQTQPQTLSKAHTCMAPAPSTSWQVRELNTLSSSSTRCATSARKAGTASRNARYSWRLARSSSCVLTTWKAPPPAASVAATASPPPRSGGVSVNLRRSCRPSAAPLAVLAWRSVAVLAPAATAVPPRSSSCSTMSWNLRGTCTAAHCSCSSSAATGREGGGVQGCEWAGLMQAQRVSKLRSKLSVAAAIKGTCGLARESFFRLWTAACRVQVPCPARQPPLPPFRCTLMPTQAHARVAASAHS